MKLLFLINPKSGRGKAAPLADVFEAAVRTDGHSVVRFLIGSSQPADLAGLIDAHEVVVVFGGDGTIHRLLPMMMGRAGAVYQAPMGTENLFARQFGMNRDPELLRRSLAAMVIAEVDVGAANGRPFVLMCSAGPDASVVRRLSAGRRGAIRHSSYIAPIINEFFQPTLGPFSLEVDGRTVLESQQGVVFIGNSPMYALGLNPAREADMTDGMLDVVFLPARSSISLGWWAARLAAGPVHTRGRAVFHRARELVIRSDVRSPYQLDGDEGGVIGDGIGELRVGVQPRAVRVLRAPAVRG